MNTHPLKNTVSTIEPQFLVSEKKFVRELCEISDGSLAHWLKSCDLYPTLTSWD